MYSIDEYHFEMEMESVRYVLAITTICDNKNEILRLYESLKEIDVRLDEIESSKKKNDFSEKESQLKVTNFELLKNEVKYSLYETKTLILDRIELESSEGKIGIMLRKKERKKGRDTKMIYDDKDWLDP